MLLDLVLQKKAARLELRTLDGEHVFRELEVSSLTPADLDGDFLKKLGLQPYQPPVYPVIGKLVEGGVAQRAGLQVNDRILRANGENIALWEDWVDVVRRHPGKVLNIEIERAGVPLKLSLTPDAIDEAGKTIGRIGAAAYIDKAAFEVMLTEVRYSPLAGIAGSIAQDLGDRRREFEDDGQDGGG